MPRNEINNVIFLMMQLKENDRKSNKIYAVLIKIEQKISWNLETGNIGLSLGGNGAKVLCRANLRNV